MTTPEPRGLKRESPLQGEPMPTQFPAIPRGGWLPASPPLSDDERQELASLRLELAHMRTTDAIQDLSAARENAAALEAENANLRNRLLSAAGDDLCRLSQEEIKAYSSGAVQIPPKEEFIASCERFHAQVAKESGVLEGCFTLAQLIAENAKLQSELAQARAEVTEAKRVIDIQRPRVDKLVVMVAAAEAERDRLKAALQAYHDEWMDQKKPGLLCLHSCHAENLAIAALAQAEKPTCQL